MESWTSAQIIARSAQIRESLLVLLRAIPEIETIHRAAEGPSALAVMPEIQPALVLLENDRRDGELRTTQGQIKAEWPQTQCVVLLDGEQNRWSAEDPGADLVLVKGVRAATIVETIEGLISEDSPSLGSVYGGRS